MGLRRPLFLLSSSFSVLSIIIHKQLIKNNIYCIFKLILFDINKKHNYNQT